MLRVALTGGIATGKSHCLARLASLGAPVIDADEIARAAVDPGTAGLAAVVQRFGTGILRPDATLDRAALGRVVFADPAARRALEAIIHPHVYAAIDRWFTQLTEWSGARLGIADIPLLYEGRHEGNFDAVIVVTCRPEQQLQRLMEQRGLSEEEARQRVAAQAPLADKAAAADYILDTSGTVDETDEQVKNVWKALAVVVNGGRGMGDGR